MPFALPLLLAFVAAVAAFGLEAGVIDDAGEQFDEIDIIVGMRHVARLQTGQGEDLADQCIEALGFVLNAGQGAVDLRRILPHLCSLPNSPKPSSLPSRPTPSPTRKSKE